MMAINALRKRYIFNLHSVSLELCFRLTNAEWIAAIKKPPEV
jgi:hypothetical protein